MVLGLAAEYVAKVKTRYARHPQTYLAFLAVLRKYKENEMTMHDVHCEVCPSLASSMKCSMQMTLIVPPNASLMLSLMLSLVQSLVLSLELSRILLPLARLWPTPYVLSPLVCAFFSFWPPSHR